MMAKGGDGKWGLIVVEERDEHMVSLIGENPTLRPARFLKPLVTHFKKAAKFPSLCGILAYTGKKWDFFDVQFKGWKNPQKKWKQWVDQMCEIYEEMWKVTGIYDTIIGSTYEIRKDREMVLGLVEWWCPETNTFVFPWGEETITLEDVILIGGLSVLGKPVTTCLLGDLVNIEDEMIKQFVFHAYPEDIICKKVFPIAIRLDQGIRIALASAIWAYKRLPTLRPESKSLRPGEPRMARWHKLNSSSDLKILRFHMGSPKNFQMHPYMSFVENLTQPSFCKEQGEWVLGNINTEEELRSFSRCIRPCELAGLDFIEQYLPHRVGMQFGMDQDLPDGQQDVEYILALESTSKNLDKSFIKKEVDMLTGQKANENIMEEEMDSKSLDIALPEKGSDDLLAPPGFLPTDKDKFKLTQMYKHIANAVGAFLMMDMAPIAGLVAASVVANSFEYCDVVTTTTHKVSRFISSGCGRFIATSHTRYLKPLFLPVCDVIKSHSLGPVAASSKLESGSLQFGSKVLVMPSGDIAVVRSLECGSQPCTVARARDNVVVGLQGIDVSSVVAGGVICHPIFLVALSTHFRVEDPHFRSYNANHHWLSGHYGMIYGNSASRPMQIFSSLQTLYYILVLYVTAYRIILQF
ncbi:hypothetical protein GIB67_022981 [Kingdonia uniflora]|uniref:Uncharacterized protein n=1 Tax=Kingdonia uniflora TaxID=39325 RepID=A0A7J7P301_9MAGN|nr:hypothetical protein GIB67_022981 [Kingdonia uniflora]